MKNHFALYTNNNYSVINITNIKNNFIIRITFKNLKLLVFIESIEFSSVE